MEDRKKPTVRGRVILTHLMVDQVKVGDFVIGNTEDKPKLTSKNTELKLLILKITAFDGKKYFCHVAGDAENTIALKLKYLSKLVIPVTSVYATPLVARQYKVGLHCLDGRTVTYQNTTQGEVEITDYSKNQPSELKGIEPGFILNEDLCLGALNERSRAIGVMDELLETIDKVSNRLANEQISAMYEIVIETLKFAKYKINPEEYANCLPESADVDSLVKQAQDIINKKQ